MFLVAACLDQDPAALEIFERQFLSATSPALARLRLSPDVVDEARQVLRHRFFVGAPGAPPKASEYSGTGMLRGWVRAAVVRAALRVAREPKGRVDTDQATLVAMASPESDLELDYMKRLYGAKANDALHEGFAQLGVRERNLLRQYFGLGLSVDEIAAFYRVHRATAARWVIKARQSLADRSREGMERGLHVAREDVSSIMRLLRSQLEEGLRNLFATAAETPASP
jgi:RNA polymerase sigma-70 factor (ECF subfamily)